MYPEAGRGTVSAAASPPGGCASYKTPDRCRRAIQYSPSTSPGGRETDTSWERWRSEMRVGNLGEIVFEASDEVVRTLSKTKRRRSPNRKTPPLFCDRARDRTSTVAKGRNPPHAKKNRAGIQRSESGPIAKKFPPQRSFRQSRKQSGGGNF